MKIYAETTISRAIESANEFDIIYLENRTYYEKITINKPNITLIGDKQTKISFDAYHSKIIPTSLGGDGIKCFGTTGSATFTVLKEADGFKAINVCFENQHIPQTGLKNQAVAFKSEASNVVLDNCHFISNQDTLYFDYGKNNQVINSIIEGNIDFIFGSADVKFKKCFIKALPNRNNICYFTAPDTYESNKKGFEFINCHFLTSDEIDTYLGRPWYPPLAKERVYPRIAFKKCMFEGNIKLFLKQMHAGDKTEYKFTIENCKIIEGGKNEKG